MVRVLNEPIIDNRKKLNKDKFEMLKELRRNYPPLIPVHLFKENIKVKSACL